MKKSKSSTKKAGSVRKNPVESNTWHKKIAVSRGKNKEWIKNLAQGKLRAALNPSLIRLARLEKGLHQAVLSSKLNVSESTFGAIELGKRLVKPDMADEIAQLLGKKYSDLFKSSSVKGKLIARF